MTSKVRMAALDRRWQEVARVALPRLETVLEGGTYVGGDEVARFEASFAEQSGISHCVGVGSGLDALEMALRALGVGPGHRVILPAFTFIATWTAVLRAGAIPVGVDVDYSTGNLNLNQVEAELNRGAHAVVPVALYGIPLDWSRLVSLAGEDLPIAVDAAQFHGVPIPEDFRHRNASAWSYSFYPTKNLGAIGDAGAVLVPSTETADVLRQLRSYGSKVNSPYEYERVGFNSRLDPLQAAYLDSTLPLLPRWNARRQQVSQVYMEEMGDHSGAVLRWNGPSDTPSAWHHFALRSTDRVRLQGFLQSRSIECGVHYPYVAAYEIERIANVGHVNSRRYIGAETLAQSVVTLPVHPWLEDSEVERVCHALAAASRQGLICAELGQS